MNEDPLFVVASFIAITGAHLTSSSINTSRAIGFAIWLVSNGYFGYRFLIQPKYFPALTFLIYELYNIRGLINNM